MQLRVDQLILKNFNSYLDVTIELDETINLISGDNGTGKTTIVEGINLLLFNHHRKNLEDYINEHKESFYIALIGEMDNKPLSISLSYDGKKSTKILIHGEVEVHGAEANKYLDKLLNQKLSVIGTVFSNNTPNLITTTPANSREHLKEIYDINFKKKIEDYDKTVKKLDKVDKKEIENQLYHLLHKTYEEHEIKEMPFDSIKYEDLNQDITNLTQELSGIGLYNEKVNSIEKELKTHKGFVVDKQSQVLENTKSINTTQTKYDTLLNDTLITTMNSELNEFEIKLNELKVIRCKRYEDSIISELQKTKTTYELEYKLLVKKQKDLSDGICPTCGKDCDVHEQEDMVAGITGFKQNIDKVSTELTKEQVTKLDINTKYDSNEKVKQQKEMLQLKIQNQTKLIADQKVYNDTKLKEHLLTIEDLNSKQLELDKAISLVEEQVTTLELNLTDAKQLSNNDLDENSINLQISEKRALVRQYEALTTLNESSNTFNNQLVEQENKDKKEIKNFQKKLDKLQEKINNYLEAILILKKELPAYIISKLVKSIENKMNTIVNDIYRDGYEVSIVENKAGINVLYKNGRDVRLSSNWEAQLYGLTYSLALNELIGHSVMFLDEPDSASSEGNSHKFFDFLLNYLEDKEIQVIVISHKATVLEKINNVKGTTFLLDNGGIRRV